MERNARATRPSHYQVYKNKKEIQRYGMKKAGGKNSVWKEKNLHKGLYLENSVTQKHKNQTIKQQNKI
jgi:hypothetical protein